MKWYYNSVVLAVFFTVMWCFLVLILDFNERMIGVLILAVVSTDQVEQNVRRDLERKKSKRRDEFDACPTCSKMPHLED